MFSGMLIFAWFAFIAPIKTWLLKSFTAFDWSYKVCYEWGLTDGKNGCTFDGIKIEFIWKEFVKFATDIKFTNVSTRSRESNTGFREAYWNTRAICISYREFVLARADATTLTASFAL